LSFVPRDLHSWAYSELFFNIYNRNVPGLFASLLCQSSLKDCSEPSLGCIYRCDFDQLQTVDRCFLILILLVILILYGFGFGVGFGFNSINQTSLRM
jgi:hypothetical protein